MFIWRPGHHVNFLVYSFLCTAFKTENVLTFHILKTELINEYFNICCEVDHRKTKNVYFNDSKANNEQKKFLRRRKFFKIYIYKWLFQWFCIRVNIYATVSIMTFFFFLRKSLQCVWSYSCIFINNSWYSLEKHSHSFQFQRY